MPSKTCPTNTGTRTSDGRFRCCISDAGGNKFIVLTKDRAACNATKKGNNRRINIDIPAGTGRCKGLRGQTLAACNARQSSGKTKNKQKGGGGTTQVGPTDTGHFGLGMDDPVFNQNDEGSAPSGDNEDTDSSGGLSDTDKDCTDFWADIPIIGWLPKDIRESMCVASKSTQKGFNNCAGLPINCGYLTIIALAAVVLIMVLK